MDDFCTYCSREKDHSTTKLPAISRYNSDRIKFVENLSNQNGVRFFILSGKYGFIKSTELIEDYDHKLLASEIAEMTGKVADQMKAASVRSLLFFHVGVTRDPDILPYLDVIRKASKTAGISLRLQVLPSGIDQ